MDIAVKVPTYKCNTTNDEVANNLRNLRIYLQNEEEYVHIFQIATVPSMDIIFT